MAATSTSTLQRLLNFLEHDPTNLRLIGEAASAALDEGNPATAADLIDRYEKLSQPPPALLNIKGLAAMARARFEDAAEIFAQLLVTAPNNPTLRFNLAWAKAMVRDYESALSLLDDDTVAASPQAPSLKIHMMHHLNQLEDALACGLGLAEAYPNDKALMGALANVAMDAEDIELARFYAERAGDRHEGLATLGMLTLNEDDVDGALPLFERALQNEPDSARALLGKGLVLLAQGDHQNATQWLDRGADVFGDHLGSWVSSGWAYFVSGDYAASRARFEKALALDDTFAESHGGLAVLDAVAGDIESAKRRTEIALRLDRQCFAAALAKSMILAQEGNPAAAERVRNIAMNVPVGENGRTIAQALASMNAANRGSTRRH